MKSVTHIMVVTQQCIVCRGMCAWKCVEQSCVLCVDLVAGRQSAGRRRNRKVILLCIIWRIKGNRLYKEAQNIMWKSMYCNMNRTNCTHMLCNVPKSLKAMYMWELKIKAHHYFCSVYSRTYIRCQHAELDINLRCSWQQCLSFWAVLPRP